MSWFDSLPPADTTVPCGAGTHNVRWAAGRLTLTAHPDAEAEMVLGALGGDKPGCVTLAETWMRHSDDLTVLTSGPRCDADRVSVDWAQIEELRRQLPPGWAQLISGMRPSPPATPPASGKVPTRIHYAQRPGQDLTGGTTRAELSGVLTGRFAPAAQEWLGIDPDTVTVAPHESPGWGSLRVTGTGRGRRLRASLPLSRLAEVWACGLAVVGGHLVVAVEEPGYPVAGVLALPAPDFEPVRLRTRAVREGRPPQDSTDGGLVAWTL